MKTYVTLLVIVFLGIFAYAAFSLISFSPDEDTPFTFEEPKLPPELVKNDEDSALSTEEAILQRKAIDEAQKAFAVYSEAEALASQQAKGTLQLLNLRMTSWQMPTYFLSLPDPENGNARNFSVLNIDAGNVMAASESQSSVSCKSASPMASVLVGTGGNDQLSCDAIRNVVGTSNDKTVIYIGGPGDDVITDADGARIVNAGSGNDTVTLGAGTSILILEPGWGSDKVTVDCNGAKLTKDEIPAGFPIPWISPTTNFIVLADGLDAKDLVWKDNVLTSTSSGDTLTVNDNCFTVVPVAEGS